MQTTCTLENMSSWGCSLSKNEAVTHSRKKFLAYKHVRTQTEYNSLGTGMHDTRPRTRLVTYLRMLTIYTLL